MPVMDTVMDAMRDTFTVRHVYGDPVEKDGTTIIPVATVGGGGGSGEGGPEHAAEEPGGAGGGFGGSARPVGVYVVTAEGVEWHPAVDVTRLGVAGMALAALIVLTVRAIVKAVVRPAAR